MHGTRRRTWRSVAARASSRQSGASTLEHRRSALAARRRWRGRVVARERRPDRPVPASHACRRLRGRPWCCRASPPSRAARCARELEASVTAPRSGLATSSSACASTSPAIPCAASTGARRARQGELIVREFEPPGVQNLGILLRSRSASTQAAADQVARIAASEAWDCLRAGGRVALWAPGCEAVPAGRGAQSLALLQWLARYPAAKRRGRGAPPAAVRRRRRHDQERAQRSPTRSTTIRRHGGSVRAWVVGEAVLQSDIDRASAPGWTWPLDEARRSSCRLADRGVALGPRLRLSGFAHRLLGVVIYGQDYVVPGGRPGDRGRGSRRQLPRPRRPTRSIAGQVLVAGLVFASMAYFLADSVGAIFGGVMPQANFAILLVAVTSFDLKTRRNCYSSLWISLAILYLAAVYAWDYLFGVLAGAVVRCAWRASGPRRTCAAWARGSTCPAARLGHGDASPEPLPSACSRSSSSRSPGRPERPAGRLAAELHAVQGEIENPALPLVQIQGPSPTPSTSATAAGSATRP